MSGAVIVCAVSPAETLPGRAKSMAVAITRVPVMKRLNVVPSLVPFVFFIIENLNFLFGRETHAHTTYSQTARQLAKSRTRWQVFYFQEFPDSNNPYPKI